MSGARAAVSVGSNVGDRLAHLQAAVDGLHGAPGVDVVAVSSVVETDPVGGPDQPDFLNAVVALDLTLGTNPEAAAVDLLEALKGLERSFGRQARERWGPRELDLDLLVFGRHRISVERPPAATPDSASLHRAEAARLLEVPHSSMRERLFVLAPLADLTPRLVPPGWRETVETARRRQLAIEGDNAVTLIGTWSDGRWQHMTSR